MITPDDNGYERLKRWREKHKSLVNLRQREYRRKAKGGDATCPSSNANTDRVSNAELTVQSAGSARIQALRELITKESEMPIEAPVAVPIVFEDDYGRVISEAQSKRLQAIKNKAIDGGYEIDDYSQ